MPVTLESRLLRAVIAPERGASILSLAALQGHDWLALMPDASSPGADLPWACFIMAPYSNRIQDGAFTFGGRRFRLTRASEHAIHGDVRQRPWRVARHAGTTVTCAFATRAHENVDWPWPFALEATYRVADNSLECSLALTNTASEPAPAGMGWHPYFCRAMRRAGEPVWLRLRARAVYPDRHNNRIPSGPPRRLLPEEDFADGRRLDPDRLIDACFVGYDGDGVIAWPDSGVELRLSCSATCSHLVLYNPPGRPYFAVEPVTNANDGVNLLARGDQTSGIRVLAPGQTLQAGLTLTACTAPLQN